MLRAVAPALRRGMKIEIIYIGCYRHDIALTRILVASIRRWYPRLPIQLIKDAYYGDFSTTEIERTCDVGVFPTGRRVFGWGFSKLEPLFVPERRRCLILDSDTLLTGPLLESLEGLEEDFVVQWEDPTPAFVRSHYFDPAALQALVPGFVFPGYTFNTGQYVATTGILKRSDFAPYVDGSDPPALRHPDLFMMGEQGLFNFVLMHKLQRRELTLRRHRIMEIPTMPVVQQIRIDDLHNQSPHRIVIHWCGLKKPRLDQMERSDLLRFFEREFYRRVRWGTCRRMCREHGLRLTGALKERFRDGTFHRFLRKLRG